MPDNNSAKPDNNSAVPDTFVKHRRGAPAEYFLREAEGLRWLAEAVGGALVPDVVAVTADSLTITHIPRATPGTNAALRFGAELACTHLAGATAYGSAPPSHAPSTQGFIADLPLPYGHWNTFGTFYAQARVEPYLRVLRPMVSTGEQAVFEELLTRLDRDDEALVGPAEPPSRLHGDLWSGNVVWGPDQSGDVRGWLIDPAAHGGHRETDLAMLALFGVPHFDEIIRGYESVAPLSSGWQYRVPLHQMHPLLVHAVLFGGGYLQQAATAARRALANAK